MTGFPFYVFAEISNHAVFFSLRWRERRALSQVILWFSRYLRRTRHKHSWFTSLNRCENGFIEWEIRKRRAPHSDLFSMTATSMATFATHMTLERDWRDTSLQSAYAISQESFTFDTTTSSFCSIRFRQFSLSVRNTRMELETYH